MEKPHKGEEGHLREKERKSPQKRRSALKGKRKEKISTREKKRP